MVGRVFNDLRIVRLKTKHFAVTAILSPPDRLCNSWKIKWKVRLVIGDL
jgi:hypothetical protein